MEPYGSPTALEGNRFFLLAIIKINDKYIILFFLPFFKKRYDTHLLLRQLIRRSMDLEPIMNGAQILRLTLVDLDIQIIDSYR